MHREKEAKLLRIFIGESDQHEGKPLYKYIVEYVKGEGIAGATVLRGITGYGKNSVIHTTSIIRLSTDLPIVVEIVDSPDKIDDIKCKLVDIMQAGLITEENIRIISYKGTEATE